MPTRTYARNAAVSRSRFWRDTAIFAVEDDAQDGLDHVDGHRTAALVISAYNRANSVDSRFYNQASILRTIEMIFGLKPLTRFDRDAPPIVAPFSGSDLRPFTALRNRVALDELNPPQSALRGLDRRYAVESEKLSFDHEDAQDPTEVRAIIRHSLVGFKNDR
jgi:hypothetical protein